MERHPSPLLSCRLQAAALDEELQALVRVVPHGPPAAVIHTRLAAVHTTLARAQQMVAAGSDERAWVCDVHLRSAAALLRGLRALRDELTDAAAATV